MRRGGALFGALSISAIISAICIFSLCRQALAEEISITTYYPSPYGSYEELRANKMAIGNVDSSGTIPQGGLTLAPQSQGAIAKLTNVPEGTLMYGTLTDDVDEKSALHYWDGSAWKGLVAKQKPTRIGKANMYNVSTFTSTTRTKAEIKSVDSGTDPDGVCLYAEEHNEKMMVKTSGSETKGCPSLRGGDFYRVTWGGEVGVDASSSELEFYLRLREQYGERVVTLDEISIKDAEACGAYELCSGDRNNVFFYPYEERDEKNNLISRDFQRVVTVFLRGGGGNHFLWVDLKTEKGNDKQIAGKIYGPYIQIDKLGTGAAQ